VPAVRPERGAQPVPRPPELSAEEKSRAEKLVVQGDRFFAQGNIAVARQFFQRAAEAGLATGALRLAATFDPAELSRLQAQGVVADRAEARKWYERARELGAPEAEERLARLGGS
jgi:TPR repeat protein